MDHGSSQCETKDNSTRNIKFTTEHRHGKGKLLTISRPPIETGRVVEPLVEVEGSLTGGDIDAVGEVSAIPEPILQHPGPARSRWWRANVFGTEQCSANQWGDARATRCKSRGRPGPRCPDWAGAGDIIEADRLRLRLAKRGLSSPLLPVARAPRSSNCCGDKAVT